MKSLIIELTRTGKAHSKLLSRDNQYLALCGTNPEQTFSIDCEQDEFYDQVKNLRYNNANPAATQKAIAFCQKLVTDIFHQTKYLGRSLTDAEALHIRLVVNPLELAQLPFEFARVPLDTAETVAATFLAEESRIVSLTREVRQETEMHYEWPPVPRILFAWAQPLEEVPHEAQKAVFEELLSPLAKPSKNDIEPLPDISSFFTELPNASLYSIANKIKEGVNQNNPYTHINILAHGSHNETMSGYDFDLVLCEKDAPTSEQKVNGNDLVKSLTVDKINLPVVVSLSACDSANVGNVIRPAGSLIYQLHNAGIPCVFASQFPLSQAGSVIMIKTLYSELVNACDPRLALYRTRLALKKENTHDWASIVAYARFPGDIDEQLVAARLKKVFRSMRTSNAWTDHVFRHWQDINEKNRPGILEQLLQRLNGSIGDLGNYVTGGKSNLPTSDLQCEQMGLLASACKRKAEYLWRLSDLAPADAGKQLAESTTALNKAKEYYREGFEADFGSHWNGVQFLSLKAVLESSLSGQEQIWHVARYTAELDLKKDADKRCWAMGSLAELYLLQPLLKTSFSMEDLKNSGEQAKKYIDAIKEFDASFNGHLESLARQLDRYLVWWPKIYPETFPQSLKETAQQMKNMLPSLETLLAV